MGSNDDSAQLCVAEALRQARSGGHLTVAFWVDGFAYVQGMCTWGCGLRHCVPGGVV